MLKLKAVPSERVFDRISWYCMGIFFGTFFTGEMWKKWVQVGAFAFMVVFSILSLWAARKGSPKFLN